MSEAFLNAKKISLAVVGFLMVFLGVHRASDHLYGASLPLDNVGIDTAYADAPGSSSSSSSTGSTGDGGYCEADSSAPDSADCSSGSSDSE